MGIGQRYIERTARDTLATVVNDALANGYIEVAEAVRLVTLTISAAGTPGSTINLGGLNGEVDFDVDPGTTANEFAQSLYNWIGTHMGQIPGGSLSLAPGAPLEDAHIVLGFQAGSGAGANALSTNSDDPAITFEDTRLGVSEVRLPAEVSGGITAYITRARAFDGDTDTYSDTRHYGQTLAVTTP